ncbi:Uncharacterized protein FWK35_00016848 [Aphis craccivora]|uniref:Reverse transcriptase domain-containing protein n=1 Tax=Aphis craccivora TaxID=307492 RepID=A0A6G0Y452_APHCR|nr:Uncharacterized protein FWK35_00016848 [Aphis craccivora]
MEHSNSLNSLPIYIKGDSMLPENYRGISLLHTGYKIVTTLIMERLNPYVKDIVSDCQCGFSKGKSTIDHIHTIRQIAEKHYEYNKDLHLIFVDFKQAYDSISRNNLWKIMYDSGRETSTQFKVQTGLRQGDALSPMLFNIAMEKVVRDMSEDRKMNLDNLNVLLQRFSTYGTRTTSGTWQAHRWYANTKRLRTAVLLAYADDIVIMGNSRDDVIQTTRQLLKTSKRMGLEVNQQKTKYMCMSRTDTDN